MQCFPMRSRRTKWGFIWACLTFYRNPADLRKPLFGPFMKYVLGGSAIAAVGVGGLFLFVAALFTLRVHDRQTQE